MLKTDDSLLSLVIPTLIKLRPSYCELSKFSAKVEATYFDLMVEWMKCVLDQEYRRKKE